MFAIASPLDWVALGFLFFPICLLFAGIALILAIVVITRRNTAVDAIDAIDAARTHSRMTAWMAAFVSPLGILATCASVFGLGQLPSDVPGILVMITGVGMLAGWSAYLGALAIGEATWPSLPTAHPSAALTVRTPRDLAQRFDRPTAWAGLGISFVLWLAMSLDSMAFGGDGRGFLAWHALPDNPQIAYGAGERGPALTIEATVLTGVVALVGLAGAVALAEFSLHRIAARPVIVGIRLELDGQLRRLSARRVTRGLLALASIALMAGLVRLAGLPGESGAWGMLDDGTPERATVWVHTPIWWVLFVLALAGLAATLTLLFRPTSPAIDWNAGQ